jgi:hypothetical protein
MIAAMRRHPIFVPKNKALNRRVKTGAVNKPAPAIAEGRKDSTEKNSIIAQTINRVRTSTIPHRRGTREICLIRTIITIQITAKIDRMKWNCPRPTLSENTCTKLSQIPSIDSAQINNTALWRCGGNWLKNAVIE